MRIVSWNVNYWGNSRKSKEDFEKWKKDMTTYVGNMQADFVLLQEANPFELHKIKSCQYRLSFNEKNIIYHGLRQELLFDGIHDNFWGNVILHNKNFHLVKNHIDISIPETYYYGRNGLMCYDFKSTDGKIMTIINFYNKKNHSCKGRYTMYNEMQDDIKKIVAGNADNHLIVFAGDFNGDPVRTPSVKYFFDALSQLRLVNCTSSNDFSTTMITSIKHPYPNDKIFVNEPYDKIVECRKLNIDESLSDHVPIVCEIKYF